jgi:hypothetical protein
MKLYKQAALPYITVISYRDDISDKSRLINCQQANIHDWLLRAQQLWQTNLIMLIIQITEHVLTFIFVVKVVSFRSL